GAGEKAAAAAVRSLGDPHLLERRPVVGRSLAAEDPGAVGALKLDVHLETAVVGRVRITPGALVAVDAEPLAPVRRILRLASHADRETAPGCELPGELDRRVPQRPCGADAHDPLPVPDLVPEVVDAALALALGELEPQWLRGLRGLRRQRL